MKRWRQQPRFRRVSANDETDVQRRMTQLIEGVLSAEAATNREIDVGARFIGHPVLQGRIPLSHRAFGAIFAPVADDTALSRAEKSARDALDEFARTHGLGKPDYGDR